MNKRLRKKRAKKELLELVKDLGIDAPGFKNEFLIADCNGYYNICISYKDLTITIDNVEDEAKVSIYLNLIPEYDEAYHEIYVADRYSSKTELKEVINEIELHKVEHFVNGNLGRTYSDIAYLREYLTENKLNLESLYKTYINELKLYKLDTLEEHRNNLRKIKKLDYRIKRIFCINGSEYKLSFSEKLTKSEFKKIYEKASKDAYYLSNKRYK